MNHLVTIVVVALLASAHADAEVRTVSGGFDGTIGQSASALDVRGLEYASDGSILFTDYGAHRLRRVDQEGATSTITEFGSIAGSTNTAPFLLNHPWGIIRDPASPLFRDV